MAQAGEWESTENAAESGKAEVFSAFFARGSVFFRAMIVF